MRTERPAAAAAADRGLKRTHWAAPVRMEGSGSSASAARLSTSSRPVFGGVSADDPPTGKTPSQGAVKRQAVKRHHHKHNLKHRYEFLETLGKGTYGKVKKAKERSGRLVSERITVTFKRNLFINGPHLQAVLRCVCFSLLSCWPPVVWRSGAIYGKAPVCLCRLLSTGCYSECKVSLWKETHSSTERFLSSYVCIKVQSDDF